jgi:hypothetical protein
MLVPRQEYSRETKMAARREADSGKGMAEGARMDQLSPRRFETLEKRVASEGRTGVSWQGCAAPNQTQCRADL